MTINDEVDEFLEHFGKKGMKWGVRNQPKTSTSAKSKEPKRKLTTGQKRALTVAVVGGAAIAAGVLAHRSGVRMSSVSQSAQALRVGKTQSQDILRRMGSERFSAIPMPPAPRAAPSRPRSQSTSRSNNDISAMRSSIASLVRDANADLRKRDNDLNVPFSQRTYLTEWN